MEPENFNQEESSVEQKNSLFQVTPLSKYLALALFVILPFVGGYIGYTFAPEKIVEVERVMVKEIQSSQKNDVQGTGHVSYVSSSTADFIEKVVAVTLFEQGYIDEPIVVRYPKGFPVNESALNDDFYFVGDPGIHNQWLPLVGSPSIIAAAYSGENLFYINIENGSEIKTLNLHHVDLTSGDSQLIDSATTSESAFELREINNIHGYAPEFLYDAMPRVENGYVIYDWLDGRGKVKRLSDNSLVYQSTCEKELNGIRRIFSISEDGAHFLTSCPDGLYLGNWLNLEKMTFSTTKPIQGMWPYFTSDREFEFVNRAEADSLGLNFPRYRADIEGNIIEKIGSAYGGY